MFQKQHYLCHMIVLMNSIATNIGISDRMKYVKRLTYDALHSNLKVVIFIYSLVQLGEGYFQQSEDMIDSELQSEYLTS
jgi:hypothetical protein